MKSRSALPFLPLFLLLGLAAPLAAQERIQFNLRTDKSAVQAGSRFEAILEASIDSGWHLYSMTQPEGGPLPTTIEVDSDAFQLAGDVIQPPLETTYDPNFELDTEWVKGDVEFIIPVRVKKDAKPGLQTLSAKVRFMLCSDRMCLPPQNRWAKLDLKVAAGARASSQLAAAKAPPATTRSPGRTESGFGPLQSGLLGSREKIEFSLHHEDRAIRPGEISEVRLAVDIEEGWHLYSMTQPEGGPLPTTIVLADNPTFQLAGPIIQPEFRVVFDKTFEIDAEYIDGQGEFVIPFQASPDSPEGLYELSVEVRYMLCSDRMCLPPRDLKLSTPIRIEGKALESALAIGPSSLKPESAGGSPQIVSGADAGSNEIPASLFGYLGFAMAMGAFALLTPCVFPMIPITVSYFTKRQAISRGRVIAEAGIYAGGIILTFTLLGLGLTALLGAGGINRIATSWFVNAAIAGVFIVFALSLFGVLEIRLPSRWVNAADRGANRFGGVVGILLMALTFSLTSFTCTVPFVGTVMVTALQGEWLWSFLGVTAFAAVFASPFFLLALFPSWLQSLPSSGNWMNSVKIILGFLELAAAMKFISNIDLIFQWEFLTRPVFITVWLAIATVTTVYLLGWFRFSHESPTESIGPVRVFSAIFFLAISFHLMRGLFGFSLGELDSFLPPRDYGERAGNGTFLSTGQSREELEWQDDYQAALAVAKIEGKPVFIDFTGYLCTNCRWMEANIFPLPEVQELFREMVLVRLYTDGKPEERALANRAFEEERFNTIALPFYAIMSPDDDVLSVFPGLTRNRNEYINFLKEGLERNRFQLASGR